MSKDASAWIQDTIDKLNSFKQRVDDGLVIITGGDYSETHPVPDKEVQHTITSHCRSISWRPNPKIRHNNT